MSEWFAKWETSLTNVKTLDVTLLVRRFVTRYTGLLHYHDLRRESSLEKHSLQKSANALRPQIVAIAPERFTFKIDGEECPYFFDEHKDEDCECKEEFE